MEVFGDAWADAPVVLRKLNEVRMVVEPDESVVELAEQAAFVACSDVESSPSMIEAAGGQWHVTWFLPSGRWTLLPHNAFGCILAGGVEIVVPDLPEGEHYAAPRLSLVGRVGRLQVEAQELPRNGGDGTFVVRGRSLEWPRPAVLQEYVMETESDQWDALVPTGGLELLIESLEGRGRYRGGAGRARLADEGWSWCEVAVDGLVALPAGACYSVTFSGTEGRAGQVVRTVGDESPRPTLLGWQSVDVGIGRTSRFPVYKGSRYECALVVSSSELNGPYPTRKIRLADRLEVGKEWTLKLVLQAPAEALAQVVAEMSTIDAAGK
ncbi:MAG: hypothetical protein KAI24_05645 [Planctomycetes bacterium]|nr:hypothetical protein [Planctomycetota bacterium]